MSVKPEEAHKLGNRTLVADSAETAFCVFTSAAALLGVGLNAWLGWWWADPAAALVIAALACREGIQCWERRGSIAPGRRSCPSVGLIDTRSSRQVGWSEGCPLCRWLLLQTQRSGAFLCLCDC